jgi:hypothetical protein
MVSMSSNTCQLVSSAYACPAVRPCATIAAAHGAISGDLLQCSAQGARRHVESVGDQRLDDPVQRPAQHELLMRQPRQEPGGEQAG